MNAIGILKIIKTRGKNYFSSYQDRKKVQNAHMLSGFDQKRETTII